LKPNSVADNGQCQPGRSGPTFLSHAIKSLVFKGAALIGAAFAALQDICPNLCSLPGSQAGAVRALGSTHWSVTEIFTVSVMPHGSNLDRIVKVARNHIRLRRGQGKFRCKTTKHTRYQAQAVESVGSVIRSVILVILGMKHDTK
jgi:hypothetical protein